MSDAPAGPGWWQASDGRWYPPQNAPAPQGPPGPGWWQASDGQWYPPEAASSDATRIAGAAPQATTAYPATPAPYATPAPAPYAPATPAPRPIPSPESGRIALLPTGAAPAADDVAPAGSPAGTVLVARATALARQDWVGTARGRLGRFEQSLGRDDAAKDEVREDGADPTAELHRVIAELEAGEKSLAELERRRAAAAQTLEQAERGAQAAKTKAILIGIAVAVLLVLILFVAV